MMNCHAAFTNFNPRKRPPPKLVRNISTVPKKNVLCYWGLIVLTIIESWLLYQWFSTYLSWPCPPKKGVKTQIRETHATLNVSLPAVPTVFSSTVRKTGVSSFNGMMKIPAIEINDDGKKQITAPSLSANLLITHCGNKSKPQISTELMMEPTKSCINKMRMDLSTDLRTNMNFYVMCIPFIICTRNNLTIIRDIHAKKLSVYSSPWYREEFLWQRWLWRPMYLQLHPRLVLMPQKLVHEFKLFPTKWTN